MENKKITKTVTDMTVGSPVKHILSFAMPLLAGNIFQQIYIMADALFLGNFVGPEALAAVGTCASFGFLFFSLTSGMALGIGIIVSQFFGAGDEENVKQTIASSIYVLIAASVIVSLVGIIFAPRLLGIISTPDTIINEAVIYLRTSSAGIIAIAGYNGVAAILRALGDAKTPLIFLVIANILSILMNILFVPVLGLGVFGAALSTIIAQAISAICCVIYAYRKNVYFRLTKKQLKPNLRIIFNSVRLGTPVALQNSMIAVSTLVLQSIVNSFGETVMTAFTIVSRIEMLVHQPYNTLSMALVTFSGQNMGANKIERVKMGFRKSIIIVLVISLFFLPVFYFLGEYIIMAFTREPEIIRIGASALRITSLCYFGLGMVYVPRAVLNGCGDARFSMINGVTEIVCRILYSNILTRIPLLGFWGIWITTAATWVTAAVICVWRYMTGKWQLKSMVKRN